MCSFRRGSYMFDRVEKLHLLKQPPGQDNLPLPYVQGRGVSFSIV